MIFVAGIHGVGKTTFSECLAKKLHINHYVASQIIAARDKERVYPTKLVDAIDDNQVILIEGCSAISQEEHEFILDGHMCLLDSNGIITRISEEVFDRLNITKLIVLECPAVIIQERMKNRDSIIWPIEKINTFMTEERVYGKYIANRLGVPFELHFEGEK